jgi:hypothetical protein
MNKQKEKRNDDETHLQPSAFVRISMRQRYEFLLKCSPSLTPSAEVLGGNNGENVLGSAAVHSEE